MSGSGRLEKEQAMLRMVVVNIILAYTLVIWIKGGISTYSFNAAVSYGAANILMSTVLCVLVWKDFFGAIRIHCLHPDYEGGCL